jgi:hypothetical protein
MSTFSYFWMAYLLQLNIMMEQSLCLAFRARVTHGLDGGRDTSRDTGMLFA